MGKSRPHLLGTLLEAPAVREAAQGLIEAVAAEVEARGLSPGAYQRAIQHLEYARRLVREDNQQLNAMLDQRINDMRMALRVRRS